MTQLHDLVNGLMTSPLGLCEKYLGRHVAMGPPGRSMSTKPSDSQMTKGEEPKR
jgi:hypothetical protein